MRVKKLVLEPCEVEITGATLLTVDEAKTLLTEENRACGSWWWLRSPGNNPNCAAFVSASGYVFALGDFVYYNFGGVRPALQIANLAQSNLKIGDEFYFDTYRFKVISDSLALCNSLIGYARFDENSNDYSKSKIKAYVDAWFERASRQEATR